MLQINESNFAEHTSSGAVVVDFSAEWCGPCKMLAPWLAAKTDVKIVKIDVDECHDLAIKYSISAVPTLVYFKDGQAVAKTVGVDKNQIDENIRKITQ
jgi:thioredoxin 1